MRIHRTRSVPLDLSVTTVTERLKDNEQKQLRVDIL